MSSEVLWKEAIAEALLLEHVAKRINRVSMSRQNLADLLGEVAHAKEWKVIEKVLAAARVADKMADDAWAKVDAVRLAWRGPEEELNPNKR